MENPQKKPRDRITGRVSYNVRTTLEREEQRVIERESVIRLSQKDARKVLSLQDHPPKPNKKINDAVKQFKGATRA